jgi:predicted transcriptional regulator
MEPKPELQDKADHLLRLLWDLNITNTEAIRECGCNQTTFYRWLSGRSPIPRSAIRMFELMLEIRKKAVADTPAEA